MGNGSGKGAKKANRFVGVIVFLVIVGAVVGAGILFGNRDEAAKSPCQRYAKTVTTALDNCHSGQNRSHKHHIAICERSIDPSRKCLDKIRSMSCDELEAGAAAASDVCLKH